MNETFKKSMEVGYYFDMELYDDDRTEDWCGSEECATFTRIVVDYAMENKCDISTAFSELMNETVNDINNEIIPIEEHAWDNYCKGFLAGEVLGMPTRSNLNKVKKAEKLWEEDSIYYGYYQEVLNEVK